MRPGPLAAQLVELLWGVVSGSRCHGRQAGECDSCLEGTRVAQFANILRRGCQVCRAEGPAVTLPGAIV